MMKMTRITALVPLFIALPVFLFAGYNENISAGLKAYKQGNIALSYKYYLAAYKEKPTPKVLKVLQFLKAKAKNAPIPAVKTPAKAPLQQEESALKWVLIGADAAAAGYTVYAALQYFNEADKYDSMYAMYNNTTPENYQKLSEEDKIYREKETAYMIGIIATSVLVTYTLADLLFIHAAFPVNAAMGIDDKGYKLVMNYKF